MNYADILPADLQNVIIALGDQKSRAAWGLGDATRRALAWVTAQKLPAGRAEVYKAVALFAGVSARSVRDYHRVALAYPDDIREEYDVLRFAHFREALRLEDRCLEALDWARTNGPDGLRPATVDAMMAHFLPGAVDITPTWGSYQAYAIDRELQHLREVLEDAIPMHVLATWEKQDQAEFTAAADKITRLAEKYIMVKKESLHD